MPTVWPCGLVRLPEVPAPSLCTRPRPRTAPPPQGKAEVVQRALEVQSLPGALPVQLVQPPNGER